MINKFIQKGKITMNKLHLVDKLCTEANIIFRNQNSDNKILSCNHSKDEHGNPICKIYMKHYSGNSHYLFASTEKTDDYEFGCETFKVQSLLNADEEYMEELLDDFLDFILYPPDRAFGYEDGDQLDEGKGQLNESLSINQVTETANQTENSVMDYLKQKGFDVLESNVDVNRSDEIIVELKFDLFREWRRLNGLPV